MNVATRSPSAALHAAVENQLIGRLVSTDEFKKLIDLPVFAWQPIALVAAAYATVFGGIALYLEGSIPYFVLLGTSVLARYASFTPLHDATHRSVSSNPVVNDLIGTVSAQLLFPGMLTEFYRFLHLEHHRHTGDHERDPDELTGSSSLFKRWRTILFFDWHLVFWFLKHRDMVPTRQRVNGYLTIAAYLIFHAAWLLSPYAMEFILLWLLPTRLALAFTTYLFASIQHPEGVLQSERPLQATRMVSDSLFARHFSLGQTEHLMHHMFPRVPFYKYHSAWVLARSTLSHRELVWGPMFPFFTREGRPEPGPDLDLAPPTIPVVIDAIEAVSDNVKSYTLRSVDGKPLPDYLPGAHIDVHIEEGLVRQYSLTGLSRPGTYNIAVKCERDGRGGSRKLHETFTPETTTSIGLPRNLFALGQGEGRISLVAGGIGITPLLAMAESLHENGRDFVFHVCARSRDLQPFADYLEQAPYSDNVRVYLDDEGASLQGADVGDWEKGREIYMCGPAGFMEHVSRIAEARGWPEDDLHREHFSLSAQEPREDHPFTVRLARSGKSFEVKAGESLLDALQSNGVAITASCAQGVCGTCMCRSLEGEVEHRDVILTEEQRKKGMLTACVSRAKRGHLLIDA